ncbi:MAG: PEP-CTERM sorting domain-containing protein [Planctomycetes bacterium]|nr:PEP-CTERM sorting domain-containing protein [Planctomycetota bacterium]
MRLGANLFLLGTLDTFDGTTDVHFGGGGQNLVFNTATVDGPGGITIDDPTRMHLQGGANVGVDVENAGRLEVGFVPGEVAFDLTEAGSATIRGDYSQTATGIFGVEVGGLVPAAEHDVLNITGTARLGGKLEVELIDGFLPEIGDEVIVLFAASVLNVFDTVTAFDGGDLFGIDISVLYSATDVTLRFDDLFLLGDYNRNGVVEAADYVVWRKTLGDVGMDLLADGNGNDEIDAGDFDVWRAHFGNTFVPGAGGGSASGVPEPSTLWMVLGAVAACLLIRRVGRLCPGELDKRRLTA